MKTLAGLGCLMLLASTAWADANADAKAHSDAFARAMASRDVAAVVDHASVGIPAPAATP
jgi:hypothetical protein